MAGAPVVGGGAGGWRIYITDADTAHTRRPQHIARQTALGELGIAATVY
jgi:hypothetical protein